MNYKIDIQGRFEDKISSLKLQGFNILNYWKEEVIKKDYSKAEETYILKAKKIGISDKEIAKYLNRPYWGIVDKIRRMKNTQLKEESVLTL